MPYYFYLARCADASLYSGSCVDLRAREERHNEGKGAKYTRSRRPVHIVYHEVFAILVEARRREAQVKTWSKSKKEHLASGMQPLPRSFYDRDTIDVAQDLLGKLLIHHVGGEIRMGRIVETEAYLGAHDLAAHSAHGRTKRTATMFGPPGHAYVYLIYGMHHCMNVVTESEGHASAVLLRALEPVAGIAMNTKGPGLLCRAMDIDTRLNGKDLLGADFFITAPDSIEKFAIVKRPRIGIAYATHWTKRLLRFYIKGSPWISRR